MAYISSLNWLVWTVCQCRSTSHSVDTEYIQTFELTGLDCLSMQKDFVAQHQWTAHQRALEDCRHQGLDQMVYFLYRDLIYVRDVSTFALCFTYVWLYSVASSPGAFYCIVLYVQLSFLIILTNHAKCHGDIKIMVSWTDFLALSLSLNAFWVQSSVFWVSLYFCRTWLTV